MADIFISYSRRDSEQALSLAGRLRAGGANVWMDTAALAAAETWSAEIVNAIERCTHFFLLLSEDSVASKNVTKEVSLASEKDKIIVPIELSACTLNSAMQYALAGLQKVSIVDEVALVRALEKLGIGNADFQSVHAATERTEVRPTTMRIAILPFEDQSPAHDNEWFSDGLTDELISTLNKLDALFVLDRQSSKNYKGTKLTTKQIARELGVRYVIVGAVRKAGEKLRIQATLIDGYDGATLWDEKFNGMMDDIFEIQEKTALDICEGLKLKLTPEEELMLEEKLTDSPEVYQLYLQALAVNRNNLARTDGVELCQKVLAIAPNFIPAHYLLSIIYANQYRYSNKQDDHWLELSKEEIKKIMEIDPKSYFSYGPRANYYLNIGENELALEMAEKAVELQPKRRSSYSVLGFIQESLGYKKESIESYKKCLEIDPSETRLYIPILAYAYHTGDRETSKIYWAKAEQGFESMLAREPDDVSILSQFLIASQFATRHDVGEGIADRLLTKPDLTNEMYYNVTGTFCKIGRIEDALKYIRMYIDSGEAMFDAIDPEWFASLEGTPEYQFILDNHA